MTRHSCVWLRMSVLARLCSQYSAVHAYALLKFIVRSIDKDIGYVDQKIEHTFYTAATFWRQQLIFVVGLKEFSRPSMTCNAVGSASLHQQQWVGVHGSKYQKHYNEV